MAGSGSSRERARAEELLGRTISGRYRIESLLAAGGTGAVFRGEHLKMRKRVAIKVLHAELEGLMVLKEQFEREAIAGAHVSHPHVASATDMGEFDDGSYFLVLEYLKGQTLADLLKGGPLPVKRAVKLAKQIASALQAVHEMDIVHRDVKSQNVMLIAGEEDFAKLIDFGFAKVKMERMSAAHADDPLRQEQIDPDTVFGTISYLAPEAARGMDMLDRRADLYALGVIMYEMLVGARPFEASSNAEVFKLHRTAPPPPFVERAPMVPVPSSIESIVMRLLAKDPNDRFQSGDELTAALDRAMAGRSRPLSQPPSVELPPDLDDMIARRSRWKKPVFLLGLLGAAAAAVWFVPSVRGHLRDVGVPIPEEFGATEPQPAAPKDVGGKGAAVWTAQLLGAPKDQDWAKGTEALAALATLDPTALGIAEVAQAAKAIAVGSAKAPTGDAGTADDPFVLLAQSFGTDGPELLFRIVNELPSTHPAHKRAYGELRQPTVLARATPALQVAVKLRDAACEDKAPLLRRARDVGDERALAQLVPLRRHPCRTANDPCCFRKNPALEKAITSIEARLAAEKDAGAP